MPGEELGVPQDIDFIFSTADYCSILLKAIQFLSNVFTLWRRKNTLAAFDCIYIQPRRWNILWNIKYHEIEAYDLDYDLWVRCTLCAKTLHCCNLWPFIIYQCPEHVDLLQNKCYRLHKNYRDQKVMDKKEHRKCPVPETQSHTLHFFSHSTKQNIQAQVEFNISQDIPPPGLNIYAVKIC